VGCDNPFIIDIPCKNTMNLYSHLFQKGFYDIALAVDVIFADNVYIQVS